MEGQQPSAEENSHLAAGCTSLKNGKRSVLVSSTKDMKMDDGVSLMGLGMDERAMLDLTNRLNAYDARKWVLTLTKRKVPCYSSGQAANVAFTSQYNAQNNAFG